MTADALPAPGLHWGPYPERHGPDRSSATGVLGPIRFVADHARSAWEQGGFRRLVSRVRAAESAQRRLEAAGPETRLQALRIALRQEGLRVAHVADSFALFGLACQRRLGLQPYDTQLIAGAIVLSNRLAEMATGEGKTIAVGLAAATAALAGVPVHVITVNDYLVTRDADALAPVYGELGLTVGAVT